MPSYIAKCVLVCFFALSSGQACQDSEDVGDDSATCQDAVAHLVDLRLPLSAGQDESTGLELAKHQKILQRTNRDLAIRCKEQKNKKWARCVLRASTKKEADACDAP